MLDSVISQIHAFGLYEEVEIVVSDNGSSDGTEQAMSELMRSNPAVHTTYNRNETNIGAVRNILKLVQLAKGKYCMFYGDDDLMSAGALVKMVAVTKENPEQAVFVFKQKGFDGITRSEKMTIYQCAANYFYYMGNACSAFHTSFAQENVLRYYDEIASTCWPQTHLMYLAMYDSGQPEPVMISNIVVYEEQKKDTNNIINSFYYYDSTFYALLRLGQLISRQKDRNFYKHIKNGIPNLRTLKSYFFFCKHLIFINKFYCTEREKKDFRLAVRESLKVLRAGFRTYVYPIAFLNGFSSGFYRFVYLNAKSFYYSLIQKNNKSYRANYDEFKNLLMQVLVEKNANVKKAHTIVINRGEW